MRIAILILICTSIPSFCQKAEKLKIDTELSLSIKSDTVFYFGQTHTDFTVLLTSSGKNKKVYDLETGLVTFFLQQKFPDGQLNQYTKTSGGPDLYYSSTGYGITEYNHKVVEQKEVSLKKYDTLKRVFNVHELFKRNLDPASYVLTVNYEDKSQTKLTFKVITEYEKSIPHLLTLLNLKKTVADLSPLNLFFYLTNNPDWYPEHRFEYDLHWQRQDEINLWWNSKKEVILHVERVLKNQKYTPVDFEKVIPALIDQLEFGDLVQKQQARDSLKNLINIPEWIPQTNDGYDKVKHETNILRAWWDQNKNIVMHANLVLSQNALILEQ